MQPLPGDVSPIKKNGAGDYPCLFAHPDNNKDKTPIELSSSDEDDLHGVEDANDQSVENASKQIVLFDTAANGSSELEIAPQPIQSELPPPRRPGFSMPPKVLPSIGAYTVQCASCFKWRIVPSKEKYEEIREHVLQQPFYCETAREWKPDISCNDPADISQDGSRLWAIDKPNIAKPPPGWERLLRIRGEGSYKFADVYYLAPTGKRFRSMVEIERYLADHPEYVHDGVRLSQFSFQTPKPLQENYVRKRPRLTASCNNTGPLEPKDVNPISWVASNDFTDLQLGRPGLLPPPAFRTPISDLPPTAFHTLISDLIERAAKQARTNPR